MKNRVLVSVVMGAVMMMCITSAMAQSNGNQRDKQDKQNQAAKQDRQANGNRPRVVINGKEDANLSGRSMKMGDKVMVPDQSFFQAVGGDVRHEGGWVRPGSQHPDQDRQQQWYVTQRDGRELRYRTGERLYYYGGQPRYWSVAPYENSGSIYLSLGDLTLTYGGGYNYDQYNNYGQVTLCEGGYCPVANELRFTYPSPNAYYNGLSPVTVQGYAPPSAVVRVQVYQKMPFPFKNRDVFNQSMRTNRNGLFSIAATLRNSGQYTANIDLLDDYGNAVTRQSRNFYVR